MQNTSFNVWKPETPVLHINSAAYTRIAFLNYGGIIMSLPSSMADFVPCDRLLQKAYLTTVPKFPVPFGSFWK